MVGSGDIARRVSNWYDVEVAPEAIELMKKRAAVINDCKRKKQALLEDKRREKKEQEAIYSANMMKLFGEGARKRDAAIAEINRLKAEIAALEEELQE